ncbi:MAG: hypothetical protein MJE77_28915 [Proteobacteria bacterium]|nr:hypothetical protein [Pseudomonadota bacterium]
MAHSYSWLSLSLAAFLVISSVAAGHVEAQGKDRERRAKTRVSAKTNIKALRELMGAFKFGMSRDAVVGVVKKQIAERYAEHIAGTSDVYQQDQLRRDRDKEVKQLRDSLVEFSGTRTGWDVSIIDDQFAHRTEESMLVYWETYRGRNQRRFFFFFKGRLYKMFIAMDTSTLNLRADQKNFEFFQALMERRFGPGEVNDRGIMWQGRSFSLEALNKLSFYNSFCLIISDPKAARRVAALREERKKAPKRKNSIIESVTADEDDAPLDLDESSDVIDEILKD